VNKINLIVSEIEENGEIWFYVTSENASWCHTFSRNKQKSINRAMADILEHSARLIRSGESILPAIHERFSITDQT